MTYGECCLSGAYNERPLCCKVCHEKFTRSHHLTRHELTHTGELRYSCNDSEQTFSQVSNLRAHMRVHTDEQPYSCDVCNKTFTQLSTLQAHVRVHLQPVNQPQRKTKSKPPSWFDSFVQQAVFLTFR